MIDHPFTLHPFEQDSCDHKYTNAGDPQIRVCGRRASLHQVNPLSMARELMSHVLGKCQHYSGKKIKNSEIEACEDVTKKLAEKFWELYQPGRIAEHARNP